MKYDLGYLNTKYTLIGLFMLKACRNLLDVSYSKNDKELIIQVVLLNGKTLSDEVKKDLHISFPEFEITIKELTITKESFNESKGEWEPKNYKWLDTSVRLN